MSKHGGNTVEMAQRLGISPASLFDFSANINPLGMPPRTKKLIIDNLSCIERYPDVDYRHLHNALAKANNCDVENVIAGNGATELIYAIVRYLNPKKAMLLTPGFAEYRQALRQHHCEIIDYELLEVDNFQPDADLFKALSQQQPDCLFIATPNNPTGLMPEAEFLQALTLHCQHLNIALIVDEAFIDFLPEGSSLASQLSENKSLYLLRSLTKFFALPGLRLGYLLSGDKAAIAQMKNNREPWTINALAALVGENLLNDEHYIQQSHQEIARQRDFLLEQLQQFPQLTLWPPRANYIFLRCDLAIDLQTALLQHKILIRHCQNYPGLDKRYYRIAIRGSAENQRLISALRMVFAHG